MKKSGVSYGMDDGSNVVVVVDRFQDNLNIAMEQSRFREEFGFLSQCLCVGSIRLALRVQFESWTLIKQKFLLSISFRMQIQSKLTLIPETIKVMWWKSGSRKALTVEPSLTCSTTALIG